MKTRARAQQVEMMESKGRSGGAEREEEEADKLRQQLDSMQVD